MEGCIRIGSSHLISNWFGSNFLLLYVRYVMTTTDSSHNYKSNKSRYSTSTSVHSPILYFSLSHIYLNGKIWWDGWLDQCLILVRLTLTATAARHHGRGFWVLAVRLRSMGSSNSKACSCSWFLMSLHKFKYSVCTPRAELNLKRRRHAWTTWTWT